MSKPTTTTLDTPSPFQKAHRPTARATGSSRLYHRRRQASTTLCRDRRQRQHARHDPMNRPPRCRRWPRCQDRSGWRELAPLAGSGPGGQDFELHLPVQLGISGLVDLPHAALADEGAHVVMAESRTDVQRHGSVLDVAAEQTGWIIGFRAVGGTTPAPRRLASGPRRHIMCLSGTVKLD